MFNSATVLQRPILQHSPKGERVLRSKIGINPQHLTPKVLHFYVKSGLFCNTCNSVAQRLQRKLGTKLKMALRNTLGKCATVLRGCCTLYKGLMGAAHFMYDWLTDIISKEYMNNKGITGRGHLVK
jgi:hypothetical protein